MLQPGGDRRGARADAAGRSPSSAVRRAHARSAGDAHVKEGRMKMPIVKTAALMLGLATLALRAQGQEIAPGISFSGYGTLGAVHSGNDHADYIADAFHPNGPGFSRRWSADVDSRLGGQVTAAFTPNLSAVLQVTLQQRYDNTYRPMLRWADVKGQAPSHLSRAAGRV